MKKFDNIWKFLILYNAIVVSMLVFALSSCMK